MIDFSVSLWPLLAVALVNFVLSWVYYSPLAPWFKVWQKSVGFDPNKTEMTEQDKKDMPRLMGGALVATFIFSYGLQMVVHSVHAQDFLSGALVGVVAWFTFAITHSLNTQFEGRKPVVLLINNGLYLLTYAGFGGLIAVWK
jgi:UDP-N-acetylmuramyl pentapeptide phosphotransferase/UDP-N-acetylglucosamine-1-phosphate transferase